MCDVELIFGSCDVVLVECRLEYFKSYNVFGCESLFGGNSEVNGYLGGEHFSL